MGEIHVISENDLQHVKKIGRRIRACCPVHNSRDRDLSIAPFSDDYLTEDEEKLAGFGYCHSANCGAVVLIAEWNPEAASRILKKPVKASRPRWSMSADELEQAEEWQKRELSHLNKIYDTAAGQLQHLRSYAYLAQRGLGSRDALDMLAQVGAGYIPPADEWRRRPPLELSRWCDRIIFPFTTRDGERGFQGRALRLWRPGMDEQEHKRLLDEHDARVEEEHGKEEAGRYQIRRWLKTYRSGFFNAQAMAEHHHVYAVEGAFDAMPLLLTGLNNVIALAGTHFDIQAIPKRVFSLTLAFDADVQGKTATDRVLDLLGGVGITAELCLPPTDDLGKDWSERYRKAGLAGLSALFAHRHEEAQEQAVEQVAPAPAEAPYDEVSSRCSVCGLDVEEADDPLNFIYTADGMPFCAKHAPGHEQQAEQAPEHEGVDNVDPPTDLQGEQTVTPPDPTSEFDQAASQPDKTNEQIEVMPSEPKAACAICGADVERCCSAGVAYCAQHWPYGEQEPVRAGDVCCRCGSVAAHASPGGDTYCTTHYQCIRGHAPRWRKAKQSLWLCACYFEQATPIRPTRRRSGSKAPKQKSPAHPVAQKVVELFGPCATERSGPCGSPEFELMQERVYQEKLQRYHDEMDELAWWKEAIQIAKEGRKAKARKGR